MNEESKEILLGFEERVQNVIFNTKMKMFEIEEKRILDQKISFFDKMIGKEELRKAKLNNLYAKRQYAVRQFENVDDRKTDINEIISDLYAYSHINLNKQFTSEMTDIYEEICNDSKMKSLINKSIVNELMQRKINDNISINIFLEDNIKGNGKIGKEITKLEMNTDKLNRKTNSLKINDETNIYKKFEL